MKVVCLTNKPVMLSGANTSETRIAKTLRADARNGLGKHLSLFAVTQRFATGNSRRSFAPLRMTEIEDANPFL